MTRDTFALALLSATLITPSPAAAGADAPRGSYKLCYRIKPGGGPVQVPCPKAPPTCDEVEFCDGEGACWCGPPDAKENPRPDHTGLPLVAREAVESGWTCDLSQTKTVMVGDCIVASWTCDRHVCRDSAGHSWRP
jgi:hypothetical protein